MDEVKVFRLMTMHQALKLEIKGLKNSRGSVYAQIKRELGFKGNKQKVYDQLTKYIEDYQDE